MLKSVKITIRKPKIKFNQETWYRLLFMMVICKDSLFDFFRAAMTKLPILNNFDFLFFPVAFTILFFASGMHHNLSHIKKGSLLIVVFFTSAILLSCILYPVNVEYIFHADMNGVVRITSYILPCLFYFYVGEHFDPTEKRMDAISQCCWIAIGVRFLYLAYYLQTRTIREDDMAAAYSLLLPTLIIINQAFKKKNLFDIAAAVLGLVHALIMGTRGPVIIILCFIFVCFVYYSGEKMRKRILILFLLTSAAILLISSDLWTEMLMGIKTTLSSNGYSTRVVDSMITGISLENSSGRDNIYELLLEKLQERPLLGYGVYGEWQFVGYSAHNIYIEALFQYGIIIGSILIISALVGYLYALLRNKEPNAVQWLLIMGCFVFVRGIFGCEILYWPTALLLGSIVGQNYEIKAFTV